MNVKVLPFLQLSVSRKHTENLVYRLNLKKHGIGLVTQYCSFFIYSSKLSLRICMFDSCKIRKKKQDMKLKNLRSIV